MKKKCLTAALFAAVLCLFGCGNTDVAYDPYLYVTSEVVDSLKTGAVPEFTLEVPQVTDEEVQAQIDSRLSSLDESVEVTDRPVKDGDTVNIDFVGKLNGEAFEGGTSEGYDLTIGSGSFIDGFESGLIGAKIGEKRDLDLTFPEDYGSAELAGQKTVFTVTINSISETKTYGLTDDTAKKLDDTVSTAAQLRDKIEEELATQARQDYEANLSAYTLIDIVKKAEFKEIPEDMLNAQKDKISNNAMYEMQSTAQFYGLSLDDLINYQFGSMAGYIEYISEMAEESMKQEIMINAIGKALGYKASYKEIKAYAEEGAVDGEKPSDYMKSVGGESAIATAIISQKVLDYLEKTTELE